MYTVIKYKAVLHETEEVGIATDRVTIYKLHKIPRMTLAEDTTFMNVGDGVEH